MNDIPVFVCVCVCVCVSNYFRFFLNHQSLT